MLDFGFIAIIIMFFAVAAGFVTLCDRLVGHEEPAHIDEERAQGEEAA